VTKSRCVPGNKKNDGETEEKEKEKEKRRDGKHQYEEVSLLYF